jgi:hypothetical protein
MERHAVSMTPQSPMQRTWISPDSHARTRLPTPLYGASVVTLTVFLTGLIVGRPAVEGYLIRAELAIEARTPPEVSEPTDVTPASRSPDDILPNVSWQSLLATAVQQADARVSADVTEANSQEVDQRIAEVARQVRVIPDASSDGRPRLRVVFRGTDPAWSLALIQSLTQSLLDGSSETVRDTPRYDALIARAQWSVDQHRHYVRKAQFDLENHGDGEASALLHADAVQAQMQYEQSEAVLNGLLAARAEELDQRRSSRRWLTMPAEITRRFGGSPSRGRVIAIGLLAVCCGVGVAWQIVRVRSECDRIGLAPTARAGSGTATGLGLAQGVRPAPVHRVRSIRWTTTACEWTLLVTVALFCLAAIGDASLPARMRADLFGTFGETVSGVLHR